MTGAARTGRIVLRMEPSDMEIIERAAALTGSSDRVWYALPRGRDQAIAGW